MSLIVMKFGGTSVANLEKIRNVADIVDKEHKSNKIIVILSAMAGVTNQLQTYLDQIKSEFTVENDLVLTSGEQIVQRISRASPPSSKNSGAAVRARIHFWFVLNQSSMLGQAKNNYLLQSEQSDHSKCSVVLKNLNFPW